MSNLNKVMLIGRLGQDPETRYTKSGQAVANFTMATNDFWRDKQGNRQERTEWHNIVVWGQQAEFAQNYLNKGRLIYVEGRLQTRDWTDNNNVRHFRTEVVANTIQLLDRPGESQGGAPQRAQGGPPRQQQGGQRQQGGYNQGRVQDSGGDYPPQEEPYLEDDIPF